MHTHTKERRVFNATSISQRNFLGRMRWSDCLTIEIPPPSSYYTRRRRRLLQTALERWLTSYTNPPSSLSVFVFCEIATNFLVFVREKEFFDRWPRTNNEFVARNFNPRWQIGDDDAKKERRTFSSQLTKSNGGKCRPLLSGVPSPNNGMRSSFVNERERERERSLWFGAQKHLAASEL